MRNRQAFPVRLFGDWGRIGVGSRDVAYSRDLSQLLRLAVRRSFVWWVCRFSTTITTANLSMQGENNAYTRVNRRLPPRYLA